MQNPESLDAEAFLTLLEEVYADLKQVRRSIRMDDVIASGLGIDSLDALELLIAVEGRHGVQLVSDPRVAGVVTVRDLFELVVAQVCAERQA
jgi:acyl carrier protein